MENTKEIKIGKFTVSEKSLQGVTLDEAKKTFSFADPRQVEAAFKIANPKPKGRKKKPTPKKD